MINWHQIQLEGQSQQEHDRKKKKRSHGPALFLCLVLWSVSLALTQRGFTEGRNMDMFPCDTLTGSLVHYLSAKMHGYMQPNEHARTYTLTHATQKTGSSAHLSEGERAIQVQLVVS